jgi:hypothetical protein
VVRHGIAFALGLHIQGVHFVANAVGYTINPVSTVEFDTKNRAACTREVTGITGREDISMHEEICDEAR